MNIASFSKSPTSERILGGWMRYKKLSKISSTGSRISGPLNLDHQYQKRGDQEDLECYRVIARPERRRVEKKFGGVQELGPSDHFECGMLNGNLSALR